MRWWSVAGCVVVAFVSNLGCDRSPGTTGEALAEGAAGVQSTGIAECDTYLAKLAQCGQMPASTIEQMRQGYAMGAANPALKPQMATTCSQAAATVTCNAVAPGLPPAAGGSPPPALPASNFGAIATSEGTSVFGLALNQPSQAAARAAALAQCGRANCKVGEAFPGGHCVVVATVDMSGKIGVAWGNEPTMEGAVKALTGICAQNRLQCPVVASGCSDGIDAPSTLGGGTVSATPPPPIAQFKPKPRPQVRACQSDRDCSPDKRCVVYRCPGCNKCEPRAGGGGGGDPSVLKLGDVCGGATGHCGPGLTCNNTTLRCERASGGAPR